MSITISQKNANYRKSSFIHERKYDFEQTVDILDHSRYEYWNKFIGSEKLVEKSLKHRDLSKASFIRILHSKDFSVKILEEQYNPDELEAFQNIKLPDSLIKISQGKDNKFISFLIPFLQLGYGKLQEYIHKNEKVITDSATDAILSALVEQLLRLSIRTLILELNVERVSGTLKGSTPEERYHFFNDILLKDKEFVQKIYDEYPLLVRLLLTTASRWACNVSEIINNYCNDKKKLGETFGIDEGACIELIKLGTGDLHKKGKSVAHLKLTDGTKIVYKPRSLKLDVNFQELLEWLNNKNLAHSLYKTKIVLRDDYGWVEFIEPSSCQKEIEIKNFYHRTGYYLGLLYAINAVDFHYENIIAMGEQPVLVDLEAIFHQDVIEFDGETALDKSRNFIQMSVLQIGLLPTSFFSAKNKKGVDLSGIGASEGQYYPNKVATLDKTYSDEMVIVRKEVQVPAGHNRPKLNEEYTDPYQYKGSIIKGFEEVYKLIMNNKTEFKNLIDSLFSEVHTRQIVRQTKRYSDILQIGNHPDFMRDGLDREMLIDKLWLDTLYLPDLTKVISSEISDMLLGDVPLFTKIPSQPHLWDSRGNCIENFFKKDALSICRDKIDHMNRFDMDRQIELIETSMLSIKKPENRQLNNLKKGSDYSKDEYLKEAIKIGEYLLTKAIYGSNNGERDIAWIGCNLIGDEEFEWKIQPIGTNLYDGLGGIAIFYGYLYKLTGRADFRDTAEQAIVPLLAKLQDPKYPNIGAFTGLSSDLYVLSHMSELLQKPELLEEATSLIPLLDESIETDEQFDIIGGAAGAIIVLLDLYEFNKNPIFLKLAQKCGNYLVKSAVPIGEDGGMGWNGQSSSAPLGGFAHGVAGIAAALAKLQKYIDNHSYSHTISAALTFERSLYDSKKRNWYDLRSVQGQTHKDLEVFPTAWCHGAAGICLSRILLWNLGYKDELFEEEIRIAVDTTLKFGFVKDHSLCHGDIGNIEILNYANNFLKSEKLLAGINNYKSRLLNEIKNGVYWCGLPTLHETPGLMVGLSGIGLGLLKLYDEHKVPSVLKLDSAFSVKN